MKYRVTKTYPHSLGLSVCFRQHKSNSHCAQLHGYALAFIFTFEADTLDSRDWVVDFGSFKNLKTWLEINFDHRTIVAEDDPFLVEFERMHSRGILNMHILQRVGIESFAERAGKFCQSYVRNMAGDRVRLISAECREHDANGATWFPDEPVQEPETAGE